MKETAKPFKTHYAQLKLPRKRIALIRSWRWKCFWVSLSEYTSSIRSFRRVSIVMSTATGQSREARDRDKVWNRTLSPRAPDLLERQQASLPSESTWAERAARWNPVRSQRVRALRINGRNSYMNPRQRKRRRCWYVTVPIWKNTGENDGNKKTPLHFWSEVFEVINTIWQRPKKVDRSFG